MSEGTAFSKPVGASAEVAARFGDLHPAFDWQAAVPEANRCLFCFDAPCMTACPTHIDVPRFIRKIATGNLAGSARTILDANVLGASCSRACPVEVLCEGACVLHRYNKEPIRIGRLQRFAMETFHASGLPLPFELAAETGLRVALVGAGPASLACAAELRRRGIGATIYDSRELPGGLNTYGIAEYKLTLGASLQEVELIRGLGVKFRMGVSVDASMLAELEAGHDAVFLGIGLGGIHRLGLAGEELSGVVSALDLIEGYKSGAVTAVRGRVAVIGAGNTAIDAAIAAVRLGASEVTMMYRRGVESMSAFGFEYEHAKAEGVRFLWFSQVVGLVGDQRVSGVRVGRLEGTEDGSLVAVAGSEFEVGVEMVVLAIGQGTHSSFAAGKVTVERGRIVVDRATGQTSNPKYFAGGDCANGGREVVDGVAEGKRAGAGIAAWLGGTGGHPTLSKIAKDGAPGIGGSL